MAVQGKAGHVVVDAEDALIAALKVKIQRPEALIAYVRQQNKRGDTRHPMRRLTGVISRQVPLRAILIWRKQFERLQTSLWYRRIYCCVSSPYSLDFSAGVRKAPRAMLLMVRVPSRR